jgi:hypothetical protein
MTGMPDLDSSLRVAEDVLDVARNHGAWTSGLTRATWSRW